MRITIRSGDTLNWNATGVEQIKNNILNILRTVRGEVPYIPGLGLDRSYLDMPAPNMKVALLMDINKQLEKYEPQATAINLSISTDVNGDTNIRLEVEL